jgi:hypothetical protein
MRISKTEEKKTITLDVLCIEHHKWAAFPVKITADGRKLGRAIWRGKTRNEVLQSDKVDTYINNARSKGKNVRIRLVSSRGGKPKTYYYPASPRV